MAPRTTNNEGKRAPYPKPRLPRASQAADKQKGNSEEKRPQSPQIMSKPRPPRSAQVITKRTEVLQPGASSHPKTSVTSRIPLRVTSNLPHPKDTPSAAGIAQVSLNSFSTTAAKNRHSSSQPLTTAENVRELNISGGLFLNSPQAVVQVYGGGVSSEPQYVKLEEIPQGDEDSLENGDPRIQSAHRTTQSRGKAKGKAKANSQGTPRKDFDIYYSQLLLSGRGSPMWIPGPNMMLPKDYRRSGIRIGDVGIIYRSEGFSFLFNIFLKADHPINKGRVPDDFEPLNFDQVTKDLEKTIVYGPGHHLASSSLRNVSGVDSFGLVFETVASEGAILVLPDGATTEDLLNHKAVKGYIAKNATSWYTYIREKRGREVDNGDIRLVVGFDKVASWGIATFASSVDEQVRLEFNPNDSDQAASTWNCVGGGSGRVGPQKREMEGLRKPNDAAASEFRLENQTVFVRTLNFNLKGEAWDDSTIHEIRSSDRPSDDSGPPSNQQPPSGPSRGQSGSGSKNSHSSQGNVNFQAAQFGLSVVQHPSNQINNLLLKKFPNARIVITSDEDWVSVLKKEDVVLPSPEILCSRLLSSGKIWEEDGVVTFSTDDGLSGKRDRRIHNTSSYNTIMCHTPNVPHSSSIVHAPIPSHDDTGLYSAPANTSRINNPLSRRNPPLPPWNFDSQIWQQTSLITSELSPPLKVQKLSNFPGETQPTVHSVPARPGRGVLQSRSPSNHHCISTTALPLNTKHPPSPTLGVRRRTPPASCSFLEDISIQSVPSLGSSETDDRDTPPHASDASGHASHDSSFCRLHPANPTTSPLTCPPFPVYELDAGEFCQLCYKLGRQPEDTLTNHDRRILTTAYSSLLKHLQILDFRTHRPTDLNDLLGLTVNFDEFDESDHTNTNNRYPLTIADRGFLQYSNPSPFQFKKNEPPPFSYFPAIIHNTETTYDPLDYSTEEPYNSGFYWSRCFDNSVGVTPYRPDGNSAFFLLSGLFRICSAPNLFLRDTGRMLSVPRGQEPPKVMYYSPMPHDPSSALAFACSDWDLRALKYLVDAGKDMVAEYQQPNISVVQTLSFPGNFYRLQGDQSLGFLSFFNRFIQPSKVLNMLPPGLSARVAQALNLTRDYSEWVEPGVIEESERIDRNWACWAILNLDVCWSLFVGRGLSAPLPDPLKFPMPRVEPELDRLLVAYGNLPPQPNCVTKTFEADCELCSILDDIIDRPNRHGARLAAIDEFMAEVEMKLQITCSLASYHWLFIVLHHLFHQATQSASGTAQEIDHVKRCIISRNIMELPTLWNSIGCIGRKEFQCSLDQQILIIGRNPIEIATILMHNYLKPFLAIQNGESLQVKGSVDEDEDNPSANTNSDGGKIKKPIFDQISYFYLVGDYGLVYGQIRL